MLRSNAFCIVVVALLKEIFMYQSVTLGKGGMFAREYYL